MASVVQRTLAATVLLCLSAPGVSSGSSKPLFAIPPPEQAAQLVRQLEPLVARCATVLRAVPPLLQAAAGRQSRSLSESYAPTYPARRIMDHLTHTLLTAEAHGTEPDAGSAQEKCTHGTQPGGPYGQQELANSTPVAIPCQPSPTAATAGDAEPAERACARSCLQLRDQATSPLTDGVYWLSGLPVPVYCDFSHDGGGWTLLLTAVSKRGWDVLSARGRNERSPSLTDNYSILRHANSIRDLGKDTHFAYRIETQAQQGRQRWGGIWLAPRAYSFVHMSESQTDVHLVRKFDEWYYKDTGIEKRMPWLNTRTKVNTPFVLSTTMTASGHWWGTLVACEAPANVYQPSPWIHAEAIQSGTVLYWVREEMD